MSGSALCHFPCDSLKTQQPASARLGRTVQPSEGIHFDGVCEECALGGGERPTPLPQQRAERLLPAPARAALGGLQHGDPFPAWGSSREIHEAVVNLCPCLCGGARRGRNEIPEKSSSVTSFLIADKTQRSSLLALTLKINVLGQITFLLH